MFSNTSPKDAPELFQDHPGRGPPIPASRLSLPVRYLEKLGLIRPVHDQLTIDDGQRKRRSTSVSVPPSCRESSGCHLSSPGRQRRIGILGSRDERPDDGPVLLKNSEIAPAMSLMKSSTSLTKPRIASPIATSEIQDRFAQVLEGGGHDVRGVDDCVANDGDNLIDYRGNGFDQVVKETQSDRQLDAVGVDRRSRPIRPTALPHGRESEAAIGTQSVRSAEAMLKLLPEHDDAPRSRADEARIG